MAFYRKNIGSLHRSIRVISGFCIAVLALVYLTGPLAWLAAGGGILFALSGMIGYCPACAIAGIGKEHGV